MDPKEIVSEDSEQWTDHENNELSKGNQCVCYECGVKYLTDKQKQEEGNAVTFHSGVCCKCRKTKSVTDTRHYNYLRKIEEDDIHHGDNIEF